jgi:Bacterial antitoxin of type II TA system, VapB
MKRTNVVLDETLLEKARRVSGEKTYSGAITKALQDLVRKHDFWEAYRKFEHLAHTEGVFEPDYIKEKVAKSLSARKTRVSAHEAREPRGGGKRNDPRR